MEHLFILNVQSLRSHHDQLRVFVQNLQQIPVLVALCETWLSDNDPTDVYQINQFESLITQNRNQRGGGVGCFVRRNQPFIQKIIPSEIENPVITLSCFEQNTNVSIMYKQPSISFKKFLDDFEDFLEKFCKLPGKLVLMGDFNIDISSKTQEGNKHAYFNLMKSFGIELSNFCQQE